jgi:hypothetical protein
MPLQKLLFKPGLNTDTTTTAGEGGWYDCDKVRFRSGFPEKLGGWEALTTSTFLGICRALTNWVTLAGENLLGIGTHVKYYIEKGGAYNDVTPFRRIVTLNNPFTTTNGLTTVDVYDVAHGCVDGDYVVFSGATAVNGVPAGDLNIEHQITLVDADNYEITVATAATGTGAGGGAAVSASYEVTIGLETYSLGVGWGTGVWGRGGWGSGTTIGIGQQLRIWNHAQFGEDLLYGPRGGALYVWDASTGVTTRGTAVTGTEIPLYQNVLMVSGVSRFAMVMGTNDIGGTTLDPMLIRWSDQEDYTNWNPGPLNQSGSIRLSQGSYIATALETRQETLVWTDSALYSLQFVGVPDVWTVTLVMNNLSIIGPNAVATVNNITYWMGEDKFYKYTGRVETLDCQIWHQVFSDVNKEQAWQVYCGTNEGFNEVWWFYCSGSSTVVDKYVVYNHLEDIWYFGNMDRTAWLDSPLRRYPVAATPRNKLVYHEVGCDDSESSSPAPIEAYIQSNDFDIGDGHNFGFVWRIIPDLTFIGSTTATPSATFTARPRRNPGADYWASDNPTVARVSSAPVEQFTQYAYIRIRGRQMAFKVSSDGVGVMWQLGAPRIDVRPDGRQ